MTNKREPPTIYVLRLVPTPGCVDEIKSLRWVLKTLLRRCELRCLSAEIETPQKGYEDEGNHEGRVSGPQREGP